MKSASGEHPESTSRGLVSFTFSLPGCRKRQTRFKTNEVCINNAAKRQRDVLRGLMSDTRQYVVVLLFVAKIKILVFEKQFKLNQLQ